MCSRLAESVGADLRADDIVTNEPSNYYDRVIEIDLSGGDHACNRNGRRICEKEPTSKRADMVRV